MWAVLGLAKIEVKSVGLHIVPNSVSQNLIRFLTPYSTGCRFLAISIPHTRSGIYSAGNVTRFQAWFTKLKLRQKRVGTH